MVTGLGGKRLKKSFRWVQGCAGVGNGKQVVITPSKPGWPFMSFFPVTLNHLRGLKKGLSAREHRATRSEPKHRDLIYDSIL